MLLGLNPAFQQVSRRLFEIQDLLYWLLSMDHLSEYTNGKMNWIDSKDDTMSSVEPSESSVLSTIDASVARISVDCIVIPSDASR